MPKISYIPECFDANDWPNLQISGVIRPSQAQLLWAAITVGRDSWNKVLQHGIYSAFEIMYRGSMLAANLSLSPSGKLQQTQAYYDLDGSEKGAISYFIGLMCAKISADIFFQVPWLMHLDVYNRNLVPPIPKNERPDLIGLDFHNRWFAIEAKGRTHGVSSRDKNKAKTQATQLTHINGVARFLGVCVISYFNSGDKLEIFIKDPPLEERGSSLEIDILSFYTDYYRLFIDLIDSDYGSTEVLADEYKTRYLSKYVAEIDAYVGINETVYRAISSSLKERSNYEIMLDELARRNRLGAENFDQQVKIRRSERQDQIAVGRDGIIVQLGSRWQ